MTSESPAPVHADSYPPQGVRRLLATHALSAVALSLPWPALLVAVWEDTHSDAWLGVAGGARMAPYIALSWLAGRLADRVGRGLLVRASLLLRVVSLCATAAALSAGMAGLAVCFASLTVALGTPAYPAIAAAMPGLAGRTSEAATGLLVTIEVGAFVVGPALGGAILVLDGLSWGAWLACAMTAAAVLVVRGVRWSPAEPEQPEDRVAVLPMLLRRPLALGAVGAVAVVNAIDGALAVALLPLAERVWHSGSAAFGLATAALGIGALAAPLLARLWGFSPGAARRAAWAVGIPLLIVTLAPGLWWAVVPLVVVGAGSVHVEAVATTVIQRSVPDHACSSVLGLTDSVMVAAAGIAAVLTPPTTGLLGVRAVIALCAVGGLLLVVIARLAGSGDVVTASGQPSHGFART